MIVTRLRLTNVRAIEMVDFSFKPGFNLIVGVNGVGKTTALDSLALCLARVTQKVNRLKGTLHSFTTEDIREGTDALSMICDVHMGGVDPSYTIHMPRYPFHRTADEAGQMEERPTPAKAFFSGDPLPSSDQLKGRKPLAVLYSTRRAVPSDRIGSKGAAGGGFALAFAEAFSARDLRLRELADWMLAQKALAHEQATRSNVLPAFNAAIERFLPGYKDLHVTDGEAPQLAIVHGEMQVPVRKLSDGERGVLAIVLDLTRRLAIANPDLADPPSGGEAKRLASRVPFRENSLRVNAPTTPPPPACSPLTRRWLPGGSIRRLRDQRRTKWLPQTRRRTEP